MAGCYHVGVPGGRSVAFDEVVLTNKTHEPSLARQFDMALKEQISVTPSVHGRAAKNDIHYNLDIVDFIMIYEYQRLQRVQRREVFSPALAC